jgi:hypothetical protein
MSDLIERLRRAAYSALKAQTWLAEAKTERNRAAGDEDALYLAGTLEETLEWKAATALEAAQRENERLRMTAAKVGKCCSCGNALSQTCPNCERLWAT